MGGKSGGEQVVGYKYFANYLLKIGGPIDGIVGINFENNGWHKLIESKMVNVAGAGSYNFSKPQIFGETEGGVDGVVYVYTGTNEQAVNPQYREYYPLASAYPYESYLVFTGKNPPASLPSFPDYNDIVQYIGGRLPVNRGFYIGNANRIPECMVCPQRVDVRDDGREQWYKQKASIFNPPLELEPTYPEIKGKITLSAKNSERFEEEELEILATDWTEQKAHTFLRRSAELPLLGSSKWSNVEGKRLSQVEVIARCSFVGYGVHKVKLSMVISQGSQFTGVERYYPELQVKVDNEESSEDDEIIVHMSSSGGAFDAYEVTVIAECNTIDIVVKVDPHTVHIVPGTPPIELEDTVTSHILIDVYYPAFAAEPTPFEPRDINIIHEIRGILTDKTALGLSEDLIDDANFKKAADRIHDEGLGISWGFEDKKCGELIEELCHHGELGVRLNRQTGLYQCILFRDDWFTPGEIHTLTKDKIKSFYLEIKQVSNVVNKLNVEYYDRKKMKASTFSLIELGMLRNNNNRPIIEQIDFPYFYRFSNANKVANWKLKQLSAEKWSGTVKTGWREAREWNKFDLIWLPSLSGKWQGMRLFRIIGISLNKEVEIEVNEVVQQVNDSQITVQQDNVVDVDRIPEPKEINQLVEEASYYSLVMQYGQKEVDEQLAYNPDYGKLCVLASTNQSNALRGSLYYRMDDNDPFEFDSNVGFYEAATITEPFEKTSRFIKIKNKPEGIGVGDLFFVSGGEIMAIKSFTETPDVYEVYRGLIDTYPIYSSGNNTGVFFYKNQGISEQFFTPEDMVGTKLAMVTPSQIMDLDKIFEKKTLITGRAIRPYPAQNIKIAGQYFPTEPLNASIDNLLTWSHRNRLQQTSTSVHVDWFDGDVTVEPGVTYTVLIFTGFEVLFEQTGITTNQFIIPADTLIDKQNIFIYAVRGGIVSVPAGIEVEAVGFTMPLTATTTGRSVTGATLPGTPITIDVDTALRAQMHANGQSIAGKAPAGSTVTIEVLE